MNATVAAAHRPQCWLCGAPGNLLYDGLTDRLFGASGAWRMMRCASRECALVWLDPVPSERELEAAYAQYYTHDPAAGRCRDTWAHRALERAKRGFWARRFGYVDETDSFINTVAGRLLAMAPVRALETAAEVRFLPRLAGGRLLDVGCGSGEWLERMARRGWNVEGIDFDADAVAAARERGVSVRHGSLEAQRYAPQTFDAITLNHVIEHVPDPAATLHECARLLKAGGRLVIMTPCSTSLSLRVFGRNWRGLEPPRHLQVFSPASMRRLLAEAGLQTIEVRPFVVSSVISDSLRLRFGGAVKAASIIERATVGAFKAVEMCLVRLDPTLGDCLIALATK